jgi:hypothetical protein
MKASSNPASPDMRAENTIPTSRVVTVLGHFADETGPDAAIGENYLDILKRLEAQDSQGMSRSPQQYPLTTIISDIRATSRRRKVWGNHI